MILSHLSHHGTHAFPQEIAVDFAALPSLIALSGPNGAGKTTLMDLIAGALYLTFPYRPGALHRHFAGKGAIDLAWSLDSREYRSRVMVDPVAERTEATLYVDGSDEATAGPLVRDYKAAVEALVGPLEMFLASTYSTQNHAGAFLRLPRAERKALLSDLLGLGRYPVHEGYAKQRVAHFTGEQAYLRRTLADLEQRAARRAALEAQHLDLLDTKEHADRLAAQYEGAMTFATGWLTTIRESKAALAPLHDEAQALAKEIAGLVARQADAVARRERNQGLLARAPEIRAAVTSAGTLRERLAGLTTSLDTARRLFHVRAHAAQEARHAVTTAVNALTLAQRDEARLTRTSGLLAEVPCHGDGVYGGCPLLKDARAAGDALTAAGAETEAATRRLTAARAVVIDATDPTTGLAEQRDAAQRDLDLLAEPLSLVGPLDAAQARIEELDGTLAELAEHVTRKRGRQAEITAALATVPALDAQESQAMEAQRGAQDALKRARHDVAALDRDLGAVDAGLRAVADAEQTLADAAARTEPLAQDLADWELLARFFGPAGIPALLIDRALPELSRLATDLLRECFGEEKFAIKLVTQKESADGARLLETLDVLVLRYGAPQDAATLSGGEAVLVSEALALAIAKYRAGRSGQVGVLLRDETDAGLKDDLAPAYIRLVRRAGAQLGARHVMVISHNPRCLELADMVLHVRDGKVRAG